MAKSKTTATTTPSSNSLGSRTLIFDNGAHTIKAGFSTPGTAPSVEDCHLIPNCISRSQRDKLTYVGADLDTCGDFGELQIRRPVEKGYIVNWEGEKAVWERTIFDKRSPLQCSPHENNLILTEASSAPGALQRNADEIVFEEFEFAGLWRGVGAGLNAYSHGEDGKAAESMMVVDAGHSHTMITPLFHGRPIHPACRRLEVGGKLLTNHLKDQLSRTMDMHREEWICQEIKEDVCYVSSDSSDFARSLERVWKGGQKDPREVDASIVVDYVLPDYEQLKRGFARPHDPSKGAKMRRLGIGGASEMVLPVGNERFTVPEVIFTPSDIGMQQEGIAGAIMQSLNALPQGLWQSFLANILVVGGTSKLPGFVERLEADIRSKIDDSYLVRVTRADDPLKNAWLGGARIAQNEDLLRSMMVTKGEYFEHGDLWTRRKFAGKVAR
ncbi:Actin-like protein [Fulvia fulva]|uniref:Actin-like protein ARP6 n=1 Tax=Passalora fulva TaxID=5499 RepID=A0A9Q8URF3_PASFU|nr:Actin-like protein [Fulvia fulva]KAK4619312.1 Actin-like protein [Fulvia fulva]KAK4620674.1 Actin-like protein [Fulvia fulva]UJO19749.1 Actin-like protein [Fulvia fulva]WPV17707.1 Actin-like protein [Fulvia fulva]WPV32536.1 Actin-like protein [Fulvia fulva]